MIENGEMMEKWEDIKDFNFSSFCLVESEKVEKWKKVNLYKFTYRSEEHTSELQSQ